MKRVWFYEVVDRIFLLTTLNIVFVFANVTDGCLFGKRGGKEYTRDLSVLILLETFKL